MVYGLFVTGAIILIVMVIAIRRDLAQLEAQAKMVVVVAPEPILEPEPDLADSFEDDRVFTGQLVPIAERHCQPKRSGGKRKDWRKKPKKRREDWKSGKGVI